jgi:hypothetical protein
MDKVRAKNWVETLKILKKMIRDAIRKDGREMVASSQ